MPTNDTHAAYAASWNATLLNTSGDCLTARLAADEDSEDAN